MPFMCWSGVLLVPKSMHILGIIVAVKAGALLTQLIIITTIEMCGSIMLS